MQMAKYSRAFNSPYLYILSSSSKKKESATTLVCDYKNVNIQTLSPSVSLQYRKCEKAFSFLCFKLINLTKYFQNMYNNNYQSS